MHNLPVCTVFCIYLTAISNQCLESGTLNQSTCRPIDHILESGVCFFLPNPQSHKISLGHTLGRLEIRNKQFYLNMIGAGSIN